ncbi:MAG: ABC transporter ATP-binding protein [Oscillospiraceae bacterium]|jgi:ABC-type nitrate/sulfonate/bicarbonate transport system ATPase subunit|nr:ABC transporter ATP-binding protein [Oscillospiraceae bacterium]
MTPLFACEHITRCYEGVPVVEDISLTLPAGGCVSLLGPSGVGKTTLFHVLAGVDAPDAGRVLLSGVEITGAAGRVSYMLQKDLLLEYRTVLDNVILPLVIRGETRARARAHAASFFAPFGLQGCEQKYPYQLSGGMRQRAALLRTCLMNNPVILLDEPFSALDAITRRQLHAWYLDIADRMRLSTIFITHDVDEAITLSDTVYILTGKPGRITRRFDIPVPRPRDNAFLLSPGFAQIKRDILESIDADAPPPGDL